jgi:small conductance mechanosensitive channel
VTEFWDAVSGFFVGPWAVLLKVFAIVAIAVLLRLVLQFVIRRVVGRVVTGVKKRQHATDTEALQASPLAAVRIVQRTRALGGVLSSTVTTVVVIVGLVLVISAIDPGATGAFALITAALGAGLGFGAQNVVRDVLAGLFIVAEDQLGVGDVVDLGSATGTVEAVGIRITAVRDVSGTLWYVRNGEILRVGNMSQGWARAILDLPVPYDADVDAVQELALATAAAMRDDSRWSRVILDAPEIWGIESISPAAVVIRLVVRTRPSAKESVTRELRARLKRALDGAGVRTPAADPAAAAASMTASADTPVLPHLARPAQRPAPPAPNPGGRR